MALLIVSMEIWRASKLLNRLNVSLKWKQWKSKELGHTFWLITLWEYVGVLELQDED
jgi:hypothetical protein